MASLLQRMFQARVLILTVVAAGIGGCFQYGYNLTIINAPTEPLQAFANASWSARWGSPLGAFGTRLCWSLVVSLFPLGGLAGALLAGPLALKAGRKKSLLLNNAFVLLSAVLVVSSRAAKSIEMVFLGRFLAGVNAGVGLSVQPMYLGESAPRDLRGCVSLTCAIFTALGLVLGQVVGLREVLGSEGAWPFLLSSNAVPAVLQLALLPWAPESPRFLLIDRKDPKACLQALRRLRGPSGSLEAEVGELLAEEAALRGKAPPSALGLFRTRDTRWQLLSVVVLASAMQLCGNDSVFREAGIPRERIQYCIIGTGGCELLTALLCTLVIERVGRRVLVVGGYGLMSVWALVFTFALYFQESVEWMPYVSMGCIFAYILSFGIGPAGVTGVIPTEVFDQVSRPAAYMVAGSLLWGNLFLVGTAFPFLLDALGPFCYLPFLLVCLSAALFLGLFLPETQGKTFLEISAEFQKRNFRQGQAPLEVRTEEQEEEEEEEEERATAL
ncbi:solute carrier family 2, facilitated glucose transporter member 11 isoform X2 [Anolis carolinensis]|uniref:solute carrier family 2, facilitated glucose transporter member 11 isoform X2 n=1 Tax=Anolis carolinensis TaxID=28377 RepID=UPI002F2B63EF